MSRLAVALLLAVPLNALAQAEPAPVDEDALVPEFVYKAVTEYDFEGNRVTATLVGPDGAVVISPPERHHRPMITLRGNFDAEMSRSVDIVK